MSNIDLILNDLDELLENSLSLPLSGGKCLVDSERVRELIDGIRMNLPGEIKQAKAIVADRNAILSQAKSEAEALIHRAEERAKVLVDEQTVVRTATAKANTLLDEATAQSDKLVRDAAAEADRRVTEASQRAADATAQASQRSREMKQAAYSFSEDLLRATEETLSATLSNVRSTRQTLRDSAEASGKQQPPSRSRK